MDIYFGIVVLILTVVLFVMNYMRYKDLQKLNEDWYNLLIGLLDKVGEDNKDERNNVSR